MENNYGAILIHLLTALLAGALIGLERTYHGRPAGFRTHILVCTASSLLMLVTVYQVQLLPDLPLETVRIDPTRMAQGIMTGIGFLGAGVVMKEGLSIRGLTTAASIWMTAAIGILFGVGFYFPATLATGLTLTTLALFRWIEARMPALLYAHLKVRCLRKDVILEKDLEKILQEHNTTSTNPSYLLVEGGRYFAYHMTIRSKAPDNFRRLAEALNTMDGVLEFSIVAAGDK